jgi:hypothetical protein
LFHLAGNNYPFSASMPARMTAGVSAKKEKCNCRPEAAQTSNQKQYRLVDFPFALPMVPMPNIFCFHHGLRRSIGMRTLQILNITLGIRLWHCSIGSLACECACSIAKVAYTSIINILLFLGTGLHMNKQLQTTPDPDFSPSIPPKPAPDSPTLPVMPSLPEAPGDDELPVPPIFPTA